MKKSIISLGFSLFVALLFWSCSGDKQPKQSAPAIAQNTVRSDTAKKIPALPKSDRYYVLDKNQKTIFEINLNTDSITQRIVLEDEIVAIAYDAQKDWVYEAVTKPKPGLKIFDPKSSKVIQSFDFPQPPSDILFHPIKRELYLTSEDPTYFRIFLPDSLKTKYHYPLSINNNRPVGPRTMSPGPAGIIVTANGQRASATQLTTEGNYGYLTNVISGATCVDNAISSIDGKSSFSCDSKQGKLFRVEFNSGKMLAQKDGLNNPRLIQLDINSATIVLAIGKTKLLMLNPDSFAETGQIDLSEYGDEILSLLIPPKANYAEMTMDYKGVTRWLRFDLRTWKPMRMVELY